MSWALLSLTVFGLVAGFMPVLIRALQKLALLDTPNERSSHDVPTPRGGGWLALGLPALILCGYLAVMPMADDIRVSLSALAASVLLLMAVSGLDDRLNLKPQWRVLAHAVAAFMVVFTLPDSVRALPFLPLLAEKAVLVLGLIWMINLTNFIDGINGITAGNGIATALGFALFTGISFVLPLSAALLIPALAAFWLWNRSPARIFLGDVGSVPLGLWLGYGLIFVASFTDLGTALLFCLYPLCDATYTLIRRALKGEKIWQAHKSHFYQRAIQNGRTHDRTSLTIFAFNLFCLGLAVLAALGYGPSWAYVLAGLIAFTGLARHFTKVPHVA